MSLSGSERAQKIVRDAEKFANKQRKEDLGELMKTPVGRRFLWRLMDETCQVYGGSYTGDQHTFFNEGRRAVGIELMQRIQAECPEQFLDMVREQLARQNLKKTTEAVAQVVATEENDA